MIEITANNIVQKFNGGDSIVTIDSLTIVDPLKINQTNCNCIGIVFTNCNFNSSVVIEKISFLYGVRFENCHFALGLAFVECTVQDSNSYISLGNYSVVISNCKVLGNLILKSLSELFGGVIIEFSQINRFFIDSVSSSAGRFFLQENDFDSTFKVSRCYFNGTIEFRFNKSKSSFECKYTKASQFKFSSNSFELGSKILFCAAPKGILFNKGVYKGKFSIVDFESEGKIEIIDANFEYEVEFGFKIIQLISLSGTDLPSITIRDSILNGELTFTGISSQISKPSVKLIEIFSSKTIKGDVRFSGINVNNVVFKGSNFGTNFTFDDVILHEVLFDHYINFGIIHFITAYCNEINKENSSFTVRNSSLGNFFLTNISFKNFNKINLEHSDLSKIVANNVKWFSLKQIQEPEHIVNLKYSQRLKKRLKNLFYNVHITDDEYQYVLRYRELFRQLKHAMEQQGNRIQALVFKQYEMKFFHKELQLSKRIYNLDRIILLISCTNSHGQNWLKPALILLSLTLFFSLALILIINGQINDLNYSILTFKKIYFNLLDPTHSLQKMFGEQYYISGFMYAVDVLYKIIYAYLVFQTVSAFRKYIK